MDDELKIVIVGVLCIVVMALFVDWYELNRFKHCYDINFQDNYCQRYLKEE